VGRSFGSNFTRRDRVRRRNECCVVAAGVVASGVRRAFGSPHAHRAVQVSATPPDISLNTICVIGIRAAWGQVAVGAPTELSVFSWGLAVMKATCLCGAVSLELEGALERAPEACHCSQCRKQTSHFFGGCQCAAQGTYDPRRRQSHLVSFFGRGSARILFGVRVIAVLESDKEGYEWIGSQWACSIHQPVLD